MNTIQHIFQTFGQEYLDSYGDKMPLFHRKVMRAITGCCSGSFGSVRYECEKCQSTHNLPCACGNRHCPSCQHDKANTWLKTQMEKLLPTHYFLLTITLPETLRQVIRSNQRIAYNAMFSCIHEALKKLTQDKRFIGSSGIGYMAVLHTWGGMLQYHPHLHLVIPGGALSENREEWMPSRKDLFVHTKPLAIIFRAKFRDAMKKANLLYKIDPSVWKQEWVVDSKAAGQGQNSLRYLARYVFRVAISNNRIKRIDGRLITFRYKDRDKKKWKSMTLDAIEFIRRFLQHALPSGFMKIRHYGFLNGNSAVSIEKISELISMVYDVIRVFLPTITLHKRGELRCERCGQMMRPVVFIPAVPRGYPPG